MFKNPLEDRHDALGARMMERGGVRVPEDFGDPLAEHRAARESAALFDFGCVGKLGVSGAERLEFLDGLLTVSLRRATPGAGAHALMLSRDGHIAAEMRVVVLRPLVLLLMPGILRPRMRRVLDRHRVATDVAIRDVTTELALLSVQGPRAHEVVDEALGRPVQPLSRHGCDSVETSEHGRVLVVQHARGVAPGLDVLLEWGRAPPLFDALLAAVKGVGGRTAGIAAREALRIEAGVPVFGREIDEATLPTEVAPEAERLPPSVHIAKGCHLGREALLRHAAAPPSRRCAGLVFEGTQVPARGDVLRWQDRDVGRVTSACFSPVAERPLALAMIAAEAAQHGTVLSTADGMAARVTRPPLVP